MEFAGNPCWLRIENGMTRAECTTDGAETGEPVKMRLDEFEQLALRWIEDTGI